MITSKRLFYILIVAIVLLGGLSIATTIYGTKYLQQKSQNLLSLKTDVAKLQKQQQSLVQAKKDVQKYSPLEKVAKAIVPQEKDQARTVREIVKLASDSGINIASITFPSSTLGQAAPKAATPASDATTKSSTNSTPTSTSTQKTQQTTTTTQVKPVETIPGLYQMEINVQSDTNTPVPFTSLLAFLNKLEQNRRTAQVTSLTVQPSPTDRTKVTFNLVVNVYIKP